MPSHIPQTIRQFLALLLLYGFIAQSLPIAHAQSVTSQGTKAGVVITIGKPSIWTLAQAHYLLAKVHDTNSGLQVAPLGLLDPNGINRQRIEVLRTMFGASVEFNELTGIKNELTRQRYESIISRQRDVRSLTDQRRGQLYMVTRELTFLQSELSLLRTAEKPDEELIKAKEEEKKAKEAERDILKEQIAALDAEAKALSSDAGAAIPSFTSPTDGSSTTSGQSTPPLASLIDKSTIESLLKDASKGSSQLDASRRLDNYIQMQYELIAKQLTLLRDEVGRDERIIFLELPSSIYTVPKKSDRRVVQVRWQVTHYLPTSSSEETATQSPITNPCVPTQSNTFNTDSASNNTGDPITSKASIANQFGLRTIKQKSIEVAEAVPQATPAPPKPKVTATKKPKSPTELKAQAIADAKTTQIQLYWTDGSTLDPSGAAEEFIIRAKNEDDTYREVAKVPASQTDYIHMSVQEGQKYTYSIVAKNSVGESPISNSVTVTAARKSSWEEVKPAAPTVRTVDIIPRQSALNVNQTHDTSNGLNLAAKFFAFAGLGGKVEYQRQREIYDQFVYQDVFASGYGKGESNFGWTFGALPGSKRISPGVRTTYAVLLVPTNAKRLILKAHGYAFDQNKQMPEWEAIADTERTFDIDIPGDEADGFDLHGVEYTPVKSGNRVTMVLRGDYFSPQLGIMVNGLPLKRVVSITQNSLTRPSGNTGVDGEFEYVGSKKVIASFSLGPSYEGTPIITLVTPERTSDINRLNIKVNSEEQSCNSIELHSLLEPMFSQPLSLESPQLIDIDANNCVTLSLRGRGFKSKPAISVNGKTIQESADQCKDLGGDLIAGSIEQKSTNQFLLRFPKPREPNWEFSVRQNNKQGQEETTPLRMTRPLTRPVSYEILRYRPPQQGRRRAELAIRLDVSNFGENPTVELVEADGVKPLPGSKITLSPGELLITIQPEQDLRLEPLLLMVSQGAIKTLVSILPPLSPTIKAIINAAAGDKPEGLVDTEHTVVIQGENLEYVERVFFGSKPARILNVSSESLTVMTPKGEEGTVQVRLETNILYLGKLLTNFGDFNSPNNKANFTYKPKPKPSPSPAPSPS